MAQSSKSNLLPMRSNTILHEGVEELSGLSVFSAILPYTLLFYHHHFCFSLNCHCIIDEKAIIQCKNTHLSFQPCTFISLDNFNIIVILNHLFYS